VLSLILHDITAANAAAILLLQFWLVAHKGLLLSAALVCTGKAGSAAVGRLTSAAAERSRQRSAASLARYAPL
jgi:hypothetical protein